jgi:deoxyribodipyrimidine photo-lyase
MPRTALVWFRRDLRLSDQPALQQALARHERVIPVYLHAPEEESPWAPGAASRWWLHHALADLDQQLRGLGSGLILRQGPSLDGLRQLVRQTGAEAVYWTRLYEPAAIARDRRVKDALRADGLEVKSFNAALLFEPWTLQTGDGGPYRVFSPFWRNAAARLGTLPPPLPAPTALPVLPDGLSGLPLAALDLLPRLDWAAAFAEHGQPGETHAQQRLRAFLDERVQQYKTRRDQPGVRGTSGLSADLHYGTLSPLQIHAQTQHRCAAAPSGVLAQAEHFVRELGWREFAHHLLFHYPQTPDTPLYAEKFGAFPWRQARDYAADLAAWQQGRTGIPIVDAGMRQLWAQGWMHNRVRMIVASLLTKNLLIPWQEGARWFWDTLVDASLANNTLGWQWSAGCGADAAPYFRIFNPVLQSAKFDPEGHYIRRWVPELAGVEMAQLHAPWSASTPPRGYGPPIIDLAASRARALAAYETIR